MAHPHHVLITGAAGFIGAEVCRQLAGQGVRVTGLDDFSAGGSRERAVGLGAVPGDRVELVEGDASDVELLRGLLLGHGGGVSAVLHLAGRVGVRTVMKDPAGCELENRASGEAVAIAVEEARRTWPTLGLIAASTSEVYAESRQPLSEDSSLRPLTAHGRWRYAASKLAAESIIEDIAGPATHLRFFNVVGPGQDAASGMVLPRFIEAARAGEPLRVHGDGAQVRTFAHVEAVAGDVAALCLRGAVRGPLNVGGEARCTIAELGQRVIEATGSVPGATLEHVDPTADVSRRFEDVRHRVPDLSRLRSLGLGLAPWSLGDLVRDTARRHGAVSSQEPCESRAS